ncbi:hypothetical protein Daus18300_001262 [Diaporthe australafricana]|uniref:Peptidase S8/S53 domain-containing protein n=1 Tax=Diaporthe australafricana TaxID=127596 RepID=A0ABR3XXB8_9PEZI
MLENATYFVPLCKSGSQTLWRSDGTTFKISCDRITFSTGEVFQVPSSLSSATDSTCHDVTTNGISVCFSKRFPSWNATGDTVITPNGDENPYSNITSIANALKTVAFDKSLSRIGCATSEAYFQIASYYFNSVQNPLESITASDQNVMDFSTNMSYSQNITNAGNYWIKPADEMLQNLACHMDQDSDGSSNRIVRALIKQPTLHIGMNTLLSITKVDESQNSLRNLIKDLFDNHVFYIGRESSIIEGWMQAYRLCETKWDEDSLQLPNFQSQKLITDDIDGWFARYFILATQNTTLDELRGLEYALGVEGLETASVDGSPDLWKAYTAELSLMQAALAKNTTFVITAHRLVWDGTASDADEFPPPRVIDAKDTTGKNVLSAEAAGLETAPNKFSRRQSSDSNGSGNSWDPNPFPAPEANAETVSGLDKESHLKVISQQKGQNLSDADSYTFAPPAGEGSWVFVLDSGFDMNHEFLSGDARDDNTGRKVLAYITPNTLFKQLTPEAIQDGWTTAPEMMTDDIPRQSPGGHGTPVACLAGGASDKIGVAPKTNLFLMKLMSYYQQENDGNFKRIAAGVVGEGLINVFTRIYNAFVKDGINPKRSVINISPSVWNIYGLETYIKPYLDKFDEMGATLVVTMGNDGYNNETKKPSRYQADIFPASLATDLSAIIAVGGVAGLAAALLSYPWPQGQNPFDPDLEGPTIGSRMKTMLANIYAYQRLGHDDIVNQALKNVGTFPWEVPDWVPVVYNNVFGDQRCKSVEGFPIPPSGAKSSCPEWHLSLYPENGCMGDYYQFTGLSTGNPGPCVSSPHALSTDDPSGMSCIYVSHSAGESKLEQSCSAGPLLLWAMSWGLTDGICSAFTDTNCKDELIEYKGSQSCTDVKLWKGITPIGSLRCSANTTSCSTCIECRTACLDLVDDNNAYTR